MATLRNDWHGVYSAITTKLADDESVDLAAVADDVTFQLDGGVQIVVILKYLRRLAALSKVIVSSGNHDLDRRDAGGEKIASWMGKVRQLGIPTDGDSVAFGDTLVTVCPWWDGPTARDSVHELLARDAAKPRSAAAIAADARRAQAVLAAERAEVASEQAVTPVSLVGPTKDYGDGVVCIAGC